MLTELVEKYNCGEVLCLVDLTMNIIGGKWKAIILWHLKDGTILRYGELKRGLGKITPKMLTQQLRELEDHEMIHRKEFYQIPPKVEYSLTEKGQSIIPILEQLCDWSNKHILGR